MSIVEKAIKDNFCIEGIDVDGNDDKEKQSLPEEQDTEELVETQEEVKLKFGDRMRIVATKLNNVFSDYRVPYPQKVSLEEWRNQFFRATHSSLREQEREAVTSLGKIKESFETAMRMLENVSTGSNRGVGGDVVIEEKERYLQEVLKYRKLLILKKDMAEKAIKIINQDPDSKNIKKELKNNKELEEKIAEQNEGWEKILREAVDAHVKEYKKITGKNIEYFETLEALWAHKNG